MTKTEGEIFYLSIDHNQSKVQSDLFLMTTVSFWIKI